MVTVTILRLLAVVVTMELDGGESVVVETETNSRLVLLTMVAGIAKLDEERVGDVEEFGCYG